VAQPLTYYVEATGIYSGGFGAGGAGPQSWGMMGTGALSQTIPTGAVDQLKSTINPDGGWGWVPGNSDTNGTALAIQALAAAGESLSSTAIVSGLNYLAAAQNSDGGFPYDPASSFGTDSDTNSTAYVVQALLAAGEDPITGTWLISTTNPISYLLSMQLPDGSFEWQPGSGSNALATRQAIPALLGRPFPLQISDLRTCPVRFLPIIGKN
jgi:prenyltransferase beta subunit